MFKWIDNAWKSVTGFIDSNIANWVRDLIHGLYFFLNIIFGNVGGAWSDLKDIVDFFGAKLVTHFDAIYRAISDAYKWINKEGFLVYWYLTHPAQLIDLLWESLIVKLETEAWQVAPRLGKFFLSLLLGNLNRFLNLIEDVFDAVF